MSHIVKIKTIEPVTHDVLHIVAEKPQGLVYLPGQAVDLSINKPDWKEEKRAFTFTSLPEDEQIEFTIKTYPMHQGVTHQLLSLHPGDELIVHDVFGDIGYKGEGIFLAGGAGVTPFIAIFKYLEKQHKLGNNKLLFANKAKEDIILEDKFKALLGKNFINILSNEKREGYESGFITADLIKKHSDKPGLYYYLCGPDPMMDALGKALLSIGVPESQIVKEGF